MPNDPMMLLGWLNMKLRDEYESLEELCRSEDADPAMIIEKMAGAGYVYDESGNRFR